MFGKSYRLGNWCTCLHFYLQPLVWQLNRSWPFLQVFLLECVQSGDATHLLVPPSCCCCSWMTSQLAWWGVLRRSVAPSIWWECLYGILPWLMKPGQQSFCLDCIVSRWNRTLDEFPAGLWPREKEIELLVVRDFVVNHFKLAENLLKPTAVWEQVFVGFGPKLCPFCADGDSFRRLCAFEIILQLVS